MGRTKLHDLPQMRQYAKGGHLYARVRFEGQDFFLGRWGSKEARTAYDRLVSNILLRRRPSGTLNAPPPIAAPEATHPAPATIEPPAAPTVVGVGPELLDDLTIAEVGDRYLEHCRNYYRSPTGKRTSSFDNAVQAITALRPFDMLPANGFGPKKLCHIRDAEAAKKRSRVGCNKIVKAVRRLCERRLKSAARGGRKVQRWGWVWNLLRKVTCSKDRCVRQSVLPCVAVSGHL
jgi:hypothetical protein